MKRIKQRSETRAAAKAERKVGQVEGKRQETETKQSQTASINKRHAWAKAQCNVQFLAREHVSLGQFGRHDEAALQWNPEHAVFGKIVAHVHTAAQQ